jgi:hypothetical protein
MSSLSGSGSGAAGGGSGARVGEKTSSDRSDFIRNKVGDAVGSNYVVPKGDFAHFMGYRPPTADEANGTVKTDSKRAMELAMQKDLQDIGLGAAKNGNAYRNHFVAGGQYANQPGHEKQAIADMRDAIAQGSDKGTSGTKALQMGSGTEQYFARAEGMQQKSHNLNVQYLEMQYKYQEISKQESTISNLMKTRHDAVSRTIRGGQS